MRLAGRSALGPPRPSGMGDRLERPGLVGTPDRQAHRLARAIGVLDHFLGPASGSMTTSIPLFRFRRAPPVGHQVRLFW